MKPISAVIKKITLVFCLFVLVSFAAIGLVAGTGFGQVFLAQQLSKLASTPENALQITGIRGLLTGNLHIDRVKLGDLQGQYGDVQNLTIDWSPLKLFTGVFQVTTVKAEHITLERLPQGGTNQAKAKPVAADGDFSLPIAFRLQNIELNSIELKAPVAGIAANFRLTGEAFANDSLIHASMALERTDGTKARATTSTDFNLKTQVLDIKSHLQEDPNGVLANFLQLKEKPAIAIDLAGQGPLTQWQANATAALDGQKKLELALLRSVSGEGQSFTLKGAGAFESLSPPQFASLFQGQTHIDVAAFVGNQGQLRIERGQMETGSLKLAASGQYDPAGANSLTASLTTKNGPVTIPVLSGENALSITLSQADFAMTGAANNANLTARIGLQHLDQPQIGLDDITLSAQGNHLDLTKQTGVIDTNATIGGVRAQNADLARLLTAPIAMHAPVRLAADQIRADQISLKAPLLSLMASALFDKATQDTSLTATLSAKPQGLPPQVAALLKTDLTLESKLHYGQATGLVISQANLISDQIKASGSGELIGNNLQAKLKASVENIALFMPNATGAADLNLTANGTLAAPQADATLTINKATLAGRPLVDLKLQAGANLDASEPKANIVASGLLDKKPLNIKANLTGKNGTYSLPDLSIAVGENRLEGAFNLTETHVPSGDAIFNFPDLGLLAALGGQTASGDLAGTVNITNVNGAVAGTIKANGKSIKAEGVDITAPAIDVKAENIMALALGGTISAKRIATPTALLENLALAFQQNGTQTAIDLNGILDQAPLRAKARVDQGETGLTASLDSFSATPRGIPVKLIAPAQFIYENDQLSVPQLKMNAGSGVISLDAMLGKTLTAKFDIQALPAALANTFVAGLDATGAINGTITASGSMANPLINVDLTWKNAETAQTKSAGLPALTLKTNGQFQNQMLTVKADVSGGGLTVQGGGTLGLREPQPLAMNFDASLPFSAIQGVLTPQGLALEGTGTAHISIAGNVAKPAISGTISTQNAKLIDVTRNIALQNLALEIGLADNRATLNKAQGKIAAGGTLSATGTIDLLANGMPADINVKLDKAVYVNGTLVAATVNGQLAITGPLLATPSLAGKLDLEKTSITIPSSLPSSIAKLDIKHRNGSAAIRKQMQAIAPKDSGNGTQSTVNLDLKITAPQRIFVRGRGIDAELGGNVQISGSADQPQVTGGFTMTRGRLSILTKQLEFTTGQITFGGGLVPIINFVASSTSGSTTLTITVSGVASDPQIAFSSAPELPQDEVLAQLIFGQSMSNLSPVQIAQLADAVSQLAGGRSNSLFSSLRNSVGVDDLNIGTDDKGGAEVSAGKYINDRTYLEFKQSSEGSKAVINLNITKGLKLKGEAGANGSSGGGLYYEKEY